MATSSVSDPGLGTQRVHRKGETWQLEAWPLSVLRKGGRGVAQAPHPLGHPGPPKQEAISGPPQRGKPETTARANTLCEQPGTGGRSRRGPRPETSGSRSPGRRLGGNQARRTAGSIHIAAPRAPTPRVGQPRVHTHARSAGACAQITRPTDGGRGGGGGGDGAHRLRGKHDHVTAAPPPRPTPHARHRSRGKQALGRPSWAPPRRLPPCRGRGALQSQARPSPRLRFRFAQMRSSAADSRRRR